MAVRKVLESRKNERLDAGWRVLIPLSGGQTAEGRISDVSGGGLQFIAPIQYRRGEKISIDIITSPKNFVRTRIQIVREGDRSGKTWTYGAKFLHMTKLDRAVLENGIDDLGPEPSPEGSQIKRTPRFRDLWDRFRGS